MTTNEMIYRTLRTKMNKEPKYREVLADMGIEAYDSDSSTQGFWSVKCVATGRMLVISKGYDGRRHLYGGDNGYQHTNARDLKKFDYMGFLKCDRRKEASPYFTDSSIPTEYRALRCTIRECKSGIRWAERDLAEVDKKIADLMEQKEHYKQRLADAINKLSDARERVEELRRRNV